VIAYCVFGVAVIKLHRICDNYLKNDRQDERNLV